MMGRTCFIAFPKFFFRIHFNLLTGVFFLNSSIGLFWSPSISAVETGGQENGDVRKSIDFNTLREKLKKLIPSSSSNGAGSADVDSDKTPLLAADSKRGGSVGNDGRNRSSSVTGGSPVNETMNPLHGSTSKKGGNDDTDVGRRSLTVSGRSDDNDVMNPLHQEASTKGAKGDAGISLQAGASVAPDSPKNQPSVGSQAIPPASAHQTSTVLPPNFQNTNGTLGSSFTAGGNSAAGKAPGVTSQGLAPSGEMPIRNEGMRITNMMDGHGVGSLENKPFPGPDTKSSNSGHAALQPPPAAPDSPKYNPFGGGSRPNQNPSYANTLAPPPPPRAPEPAANNQPAPAHEEEKAGTPAAESRTSFQKSKFTPKSDDQCAYSDTIDHQYACNRTHQVNQYSMIASMALPMGVQAATMAMGQQGAQMATSAGTQAAAMKAAANTQKTAAEGGLAASLALGGLGAYQLMLGARHGAAEANISKELRNPAGLNQVGVEVGAKESTNQLTEKDAGYVSASGSIAQKTLSNYQMNDSVSTFTGVTPMSTVLSSTAEGRVKEQQRYDAEVANRNREGGEHLENVKSGMQEIGQAAAGEQGAVASEAYMGGGMAVMSAMMLGAMSASQFSAAQKQLDAANALSNTAGTGNKTPIIAPPTISNTPSAATTGATNPGPSGLGINDGTQAASDSSSTTPPETTPDLGNPFGPQGVPSGLPNAPTAGQFTAGNAPPDNTGGGGAPQFSGSSTGPSTANEAPGQAQLAPNQGGPGYETAGGMPTSGGGGGKSGADGGPDLSSILAKFLPQKTDEPGPQNGILDYGRPAADAPVPDGSILGKNSPSLFDRASFTYRDKASHGSLGP